jgi:hypothetical protein
MYYVVMLRAIRFSDEEDRAISQMMNKEKLSNISEFIRRVVRVYCEDYHPDIADTLPPSSRR